ncbi:chemotaxis protein MotB [Tranquillimonas alkanivorans]|uniref:Chemotaxis protein MotB n=2 Tax=Tranquillimonas alkanivorans TaxID=441119 RepID=A0A1I5LJE0_9RHOB|nr:flagellar motor protein MotB [Tranquillimonas alkanivorans]SFO97494.1 chemotaxis protein MotB [Tranquillimonas alkanivorans]
MVSHANAPVIIRRKKVVGGGGHHGGAWKVAYADFVTAMMAFFMLMWLLNATTETQRKGIADYFNPTIAVNRISGGGDGSFGGDSVFSEDVFSRNGLGATARHHDQGERARGASAPGSHGEAVGDEMRDLAEIEGKLTARSGESMVSEHLQRHIVTKLTDEGLIVELFDLEDAPLFEGSEATPLLEDLTSVVAEVFLLARNDVAIKGHASAVPVVRAENPVWDISIARAQTVRHLLERDLPPARVKRVEGHADRVRSISDPMDVRNNRVELILLRHRL